MLREPGVLDAIEKIRRVEQDYRNARALWSEQCRISNEAQDRKSKKEAQAILQTASNRMYELDSVRYQELYKLTQLLSRIREEENPRIR